MVNSVGSDDRLAPTGYIVKIRQNLTATALPIAGSKAIAAPGNGITNLNGVLKSATQPTITSMI
jgi:hypothetical protein